MDAEDLKSTLGVPFYKGKLRSNDTCYIELAFNYILESISFY